VAAPANGSSDAADEEGLRWDGDDEPVTPVEKQRPAEVVDEKNDAPATSSPLLVTFGIIAGVYLLYTIGWVLAALRTSSNSGDILVQLMFQLGQFLAIAGPALWFATVFVITRSRKPGVRLLWLVLGLLIFVPLPFILGGGL